MVEVTCSERYVLPAFPLSLDFLFLEIVECIIGETRGKNDFFPAFGLRIKEYL